MTTSLRRLLVIATVAAAVLALFSMPAAADNCGTPSDCFTTARAAVATAVGVGVLAAILSIGLDLSPLGTAKGIYEAFTGRDAITGEELSTFERFVGAVPGAGALLGTGAAAIRLTNRLDDATDLTRHGGDLRAPGPVSQPWFSRSGARTNADMLANGGGLPFDDATVHAYAERAGVGLDGVNIQRLHTSDEIRYLDSRGAVGFASDGTIYLGPSAFADEETLVRTLAHERTHIYQQRIWGPAGSDDAQTFEDAAYAIEDTFWEFFRGGRP